MKLFTEMRARLTVAGVLIFLLLQFGFWFVKETTKDLFFGRISLKLIEVAESWGISEATLIEWLSGSVGFLVSAGLAALLVWLAYRAAKERLSLEQDAATKAAIKPAAPTGEPFPDMTIRDLFFHIRPDVLEHHSQDTWEEVSEEIRDAFSTGHLKSWGRQIVHGRRSALVSIPAEYWRNAEFEHTFFLDDTDPLEPHTKPGSIYPGLQPVYTDLRVDRAQVHDIWPTPDLQRYADEEITQIRRDIGRLVEDLGIPRNLDEIRGDLVERYGRIERSDHEVWLTNPAKQLRRDFLNRAGILLSPETMLDSFEERQEEAREMGEFAEQLDRALTGH